jgi:hypothetical protein
MLIVGVYLIRLWQPERQIDLHTRHLLAQIEKKNWKAVGEFIGSDYQDRWGNDRPLLLERLREVFRAIPNAHIEVSGTMFHADHGRGHWIAKITINGAGEFADLIEARVNSLDAPFEFEWQQGVTWPWDWKLVAVRNPALEISGYGVSYFPSELRSSVLAASTSRGVAWQRRSARNFSPW